MFELICVHCASMKIKKKRTNSQFKKTMTNPRCTNWHFYRVCCLLVWLLLLLFNNDNGIQIHTIGFKQSAYGFTFCIYLCLFFSPLNSISGLKRFCLGLLESNKEKQNITLNFVFFFCFALHLCVCVSVSVFAVCFSNFVFTCVVMPKNV